MKNHSILILTVCALSYKPMLVYGQDSSPMKKVSVRDSLFYEFLSNFTESEMPTKFDYFYFKQFADNSIDKNFIDHFLCDELNFCGYDQSYRYGYKIEFSPSVLLIIYERCDDPRSCKVIMETISRGTNTRISRIAVWGAHNMHFNLESTFHVNDNTIQSTRLLFNASEKTYEGGYTYVYEEKFVYKIYPSGRILLLSKTNEKRYLGLFDEKRWKYIYPVKPPK